MTRLVLPDVGLRHGLTATMDDFGDLAAMHGSGFWHLGDGGWPDTTEQGVRSMVRVLRSYGDPATSLPTGLVHCDYLWITDGEPAGPVGDVVGFLAVRHRLNAFLLEEGGHIGYAVRPAARRRGHATRALGLALHRSAELGIDRVLVTCDDDNEASRRTIESNGGVLEDQRGRKLRYWIDTRQRVGVTADGADAAPA